MAGPIHAADTRSQTGGRRLTADGSDDGEFIERGTYITGTGRAKHGRRPVRRTLLSDEFRGLQAYGAAERAERPEHRRE